MKRTVLFLVNVFAVLGFFAAGEGYAATYKYTDKDGNIGLADDLGAIPEQYRASAVLVDGFAKGDPPAANNGFTAGRQNATGEKPSTSLAASAPAQTELQLPAEAARRMLFSTRLAISIGVVIAAIFVSVFLGRISAMHGHDRSIRILRVSLSWLVVVYLVAAHAKDVITLAKTAVSHVQSVSEESAKRGEKAARAIKALDSALERAEMQVSETEKEIKETEQAEER